MPPGWASLVMDMPLLPPPAPQGVGVLAGEGRLITKTTAQLSSPKHRVVIGRLVREYEYRTTLTHQPVYLAVKPSFVLYPGINN